MISSSNKITDNTFLSFGLVRPKLVKEQRLVKIIIFERLPVLIKDLKDKVWNKL